MNIVSDILTLRQRNNGQVLVDSNLGVSQNVIIGGGLHVEGELTLQHVTAPCEIQETEQMELWGRPEDRTEVDYRKVIGFVDPTVSPTTDIQGRYTKLVPVYGRCCENDNAPSDGSHGTAFAVAGNHLPSNDSIRMYPHSHHFKNLPLNLKNENKGVRDVAKACENPERVKPEGRDYIVAESKSN